MSETFEDFLARRERASNDYIRGDARAFMNLTARVDPSTFMPPSGLVFDGAAEASQAHQDGARAFDGGSTGRFEILHSGTSGDLGYWTGLQHATVRLKGKEAPVEMSLRTTEIFRRSGGEWKLIHRHADFLKKAG